VARQLSDRGWHVILTARKEDQGAAAAAKLKNASFLELDITDKSSVARAAKEVSKLDVLVNNAAIIADGDRDVLTIRPEVVARTIQTNALGALRVLHYKVEGRQLFGVRWQNAAATPLWAERSDGAFSNGRSLSIGFLCNAVMPLLKLETTVALSEEPRVTKTKRGVRRAWKPKLRRK